MVKIKYSALYTDKLGCEQAIVYFSKGEFLLKVRGCTFKNDSLNFDFSANNCNIAKQLFCLKGDELVEYAIDIKIPLAFYYNNKECINEFILRIERCENYYSNSLSLCLEGVGYNVEGYDLQELLSNMNKELPEEYNIRYSPSCIFRVYYHEASKKNNFYCLKKFRGELKIASNKESYLDLFNVEYKNKLKKTKKVPIIYICDNYCLS